MIYLQWLLVGVGVLSRLAQYLYNRPFWGDETKLLDNIINRSYVQLLAPLDHAQAAPVGFLWLEKLAISLFGPTTYGARLVPLVAGIAALFLFRVLVNRVNPRVVVIALGIFATSNWLIYYASETKQYSLDVTISIAILLLYVYKAKPIWLAGTGAIAVWFSHGVIFVLAGIGLAYWTSGQQHRHALVVGGAWLISFGIVYLLFYSQTAANATLLHYWSEVEAGFIQLTPIAIVRAIFEPILLVSGLYQPFLVLIVMLGLIMSFRLLKREMIYLFLLPVLLAAIAAVLAKYPYVGRFLLFLFPGLTIVTATGLIDIMTKFGQQRPRIRWILTSVILILLILQMDVTQNGLFR